jgi:hypothetical protein
MPASNTGWNEAGFRNGLPSWLVGRFGIIMTLLGKTVIGRLAN